MSATIRGGTSGQVMDVDTTPKAARVILYDAAGSAISAGTSGSDVYLKTMGAQDIDVLANNSSTANLNAGASFNGTSESNLNTAAVQIMLYADQNCTVQLQQSIDNSNWDYKETYYTSAGFPDCRTFVAKGAYVKVSVTNTGGSATTAFRLQTVTVPVSTPLTFRDGVAMDWITMPCYRASFTGGLVTGACLSIKGAASKLVSLTRIGFSANCQSGTLADVSVQKLSALTGGTPASVTAVPLDSKYPAASATVQSWAGGNPTITAVGTIQAWRVNILAANTIAAIPNHEIQFGNVPTVSFPRIRGTSEWLALVFTAPGSQTAADIWIEWSEQ